MIDLRSLRLRPSFVVTVRTSRPHWPAATVLWLLAILITAASIVYQRCTGPTYPLRGTVTVGDAEVEFRLPRSETVGRDVALTLIVPERQVTGTVRFRRYRSFDDWTIRSLHREGDQLRAHLPEQPPAGKLMYFIELNGEGESVSVSGVSRRTACASSIHSHS